MQVDGGHSGDRLPDPEHLAARHVDLRDHPHVVAGLAHRDAAPIGNSAKSAAVTTASTPSALRRATVSMRRMRACACGLRSIFACTMPGSFDVGRIDGAARHALAGIDARQPLADRLEGAWLGGHGASAPVPVAAAARMASTILS